MIAEPLRGLTAYIFGCFRLDPTQRRLYSGRECISLQERAFRLLLLLIEAAGDVVSKETLAAKVWPDSTVTDGNLSQHIYLLRRTLGERAKDRSYIMNVPGKGYRFALPVADYDCRHRTGSGRAATLRHGEARRHAGRRPRSAT